jgi:predicted kinase
MRKWMSERLKRRKKPGESPAKDGIKAPEPLQPRFYDDEPAAAPEASAAPVASTRRPPKVEQVQAPARELVSEPASAGDSSAVQAESSSEAQVRPRISRRRRSRGGRGGSRSKPASPSSVVTDDAAGKDALVAEPTEADLLPGESRSGRSKPPLGSRAPSPQHQSPQRQTAAGAAQSAATQSAAASAGLPTQSAAAPRPSKGTVVLAIGLPGSGKSSWFKRHNIHPLSSDLLRELLFDDAHEQRFQDLVFSNLRSMLKARLIARRPMNYVDATNLTPHDRQSWIKLAKDYGYDVQGVFFDVPLDVCLERHQRRGRAVPEDIMRKMAGKLKPPTFEEGFSKITVVRVKQKEENQP